MNAINYLKRKTERIPPNLIQNSQAVPEEFSNVC